MGTIRGPIRALFLAAIIALQGNSGNHAYPQDPPGWNGLAWGGDGYWTEPDNHLCIWYEEFVDTAADPDLYLDTQARAGEGWHGYPFGLGSQGCPEPTGYGDIWVVNETFNFPTLGRGPAPASEGWNHFTSVSMWCEGNNSAFGIGLEQVWLGLSVPNMHALVGSNSSPFNNILSAMEWTASHEMGHGLGLGHASDTASVMRPFFNEGPGVFAATNDDTSILNGLYDGGAFYWTTCS